MRPSCASRCSLAALLFTTLLPALARSGPHIPLIQNVGQTDPAVLFYAPGDRASLYFLRDAIVVDLHEAAAGEEQAASGAQPLDHFAPATVRPGRRGCAVWIGFEGASPVSRVEATGEASARYHFFRGNRPADWHPRVPAFDELTYHDLLPGIDLRFRTEEARLIYEGPGDVPLRFEGMSEIVADSHGSTVLRTPVGDLVLTAGELRWSCPF